MGKCSLGKAVLNDVFTPLYPFGKGLEARFKYPEDGQYRILPASFDFPGSFRRTCTDWCETVSRATGIPASNIWYHELQIHAAPYRRGIPGKS